MMTTWQVPADYFNQSELSRRWVAVVAIPAVWVAIGAMAIVAFLLDPHFLNKARYSQSQSRRAQAHAPRAPRAHTHGARSQLNRACIALG